MSNVAINEYRHEKASPDLIERLHSRSVLSKVGMALMSLGNY